NDSSAGTRGLRGVAAGHSAFLSGLPPPAGVLRVPRTLPVLLVARSALGRSQLRRRRAGNLSGDGACPGRPRERAGRLALPPVLHAGRQSLPALGGSRSRELRGDRVPPRAGPQSADGLRDPQSEVGRGHWRGRRVDYSDSAVLLDQSRDESGGVL